ncbi:MAG: glycosyltransferase [Proteobacteria bacterium]|nr:glycosyltransferase [Pseudomonadota bacterium]MBU1687329.1 glycosyltransferase [Pseudomonadota bacterium]
MSISLELVIPVYNEADNIEAVLQEISEKLHMDHSITVVYDSETDNTLPILRARQQSNLKLLRNCYGKGVLNAIRTGLEGVSAEVALVMMADLSDDLSNVDLMFAQIGEGYHLVCGSRYMKGGRQLGGPLLKRILSRLAGLSLHILAGLPSHDATNSFKMYHRDVLKKFTIESRGGFEIGLELLVKAWAAGYRITEVPVIWRDREHGSSRFRLWHWLPRYIRWYWYGIRHGLLGWQPK